MSDELFLQRGDAKGLAAVRGGRLRIGLAGRMLVCGLRSAVGGLSV